MPVDKSASAETRLGDSGLSESGFSHIDSTSNPSDYVRRLDATGASQVWQDIKHQMLLHLDLKPGEHCLDVGCGTGEDVLAMAQIVGDRGRAVGLDRSITMVNEAQRRARELTAEFYVQDANQLEFPNSSFNAVRVERVLQHLERPRTALSEMARVAVPGGRVVAAEPDYGTLAITGADPEVTRRILGCRLRHFRSGRVGLHLPLLFKSLGLDHVRVTLIHSSSTELSQTGDYSRLCKYAASAQEEGTVSAEDAELWLSRLVEAAAGGRYNQTITVFLVSGRKRVPE